jgi:phenylalanyl-tRNA synthetase alpha chain
MQLELTEQILKYIDQHEKADTLDLAVEFSEDHQKIVGALKSIQAHGDLLNSETTSRKAWQVSDEGQFVIEHGSHEACVFNAIPAAGISQPELMKVSEKLEHEKGYKSLQNCIISF